MRIFKVLSKKNYVRQKFCKGVQRLLDEAPKNQKNFLFYIFQPNIVLKVFLFFYIIFIHFYLPYFQKSQKSTQVTPKNKVTNSKTEKLFNSPRLHTSFPPFFIWNIWTFCKKVICLEFFKRSKYLFNSQACEDCSIEI